MASGERLRNLRELLGLTQIELASMSGVPQSWISQVETGSRDATSDGLSAIAAATATPVRFFELTPETIPLDSLRFRKLASVSKVMTRRVHAFFGESYRVTQTLLEDADYPPPPLRFASVADEAQPEFIEEAASSARETLRLAPGKPVPNLTRAMERAGIAVARMMMTDDDSDDAPATGGHFGVSYSDGLDHHALIGHFPGRAGDRLRFTLAHELGHLVLHTYRPRIADAENEANVFAGALLLPAARMRDMVGERTSLTDYARLKATWGVSMQALIMRASTLQLISPTRHRSLFVQLSAKGWRRQEPVDVGLEEPALLWAILQRRYGPSPYPAASRDLAVPATILRSIAPTPPQRVTKERALVPPASPLGGGAHS